MAVQLMANVATRLRIGSWPQKGWSAYRLGRLLRQEANLAANNREVPFLYEYDEN